MQTILITGANGQLGNEMRRVSVNSGNRYLFTGCGGAGHYGQGGAVFSLIGENAVNVVVNCAAYTNVDKAVENLATACKEHKATLSCVYGLCVSGGYDALLFSNITIANLSKVA